MIIVNSVNDAPVLTEVPDVQFDEDGQGGVALTASDVDSDDLTYSINGGDKITAERDSNTIMFTAPDDYNGSDNFTVTVSDGDLSNDQSFTVTVAAVNDTPVIVSDAVIEATEDIEYSYQVEVEDPDNDTFIFTLTDAPEGMSVSDTGLITWTATEGVLTSGLFNSSSPVPSLLFFPFTNTYPLSAIASACFAFCSTISIPTPVLRTSIILENNSSITIGDTPAVGSSNIKILG